MTNTECVLNFKLKLTANYGVDVIILRKADQVMPKCNSIIQNSTNINISTNFSGVEAEELSQRTWLPVPCFLVLPVNQQLCCWQHGINEPLWSTSKDLEQAMLYWWKIDIEYKYDVMLSENNSAVEGSIFTTLSAHHIHYDQ